MKKNFKKKVLKNGMTVLFEKRNIPVVSVAFAVKQGGVNESLKEKGISHFIEHLLYKGTPTRNFRQIAEEIEKNGGIMNGFTSEEVTAYWCKMPSRHLEVALNVLSDMIKNPLFDEKEVEKERKVIFEEIKMYKDNPRMHVFDEMHSLMYKPPFGVPLIGTYKSMNSIAREDIVKKFKEVYSPSNLYLVVVGNANFDKIVKFVEKTFLGKKGKRPSVSKIVPKNGNKMEKRKGVDQANVAFSYHVPLAGNKKAYAAKVLSTLMAEGMSSRLFAEIRAKRNLAYAIKGDSNISKNFAYNFIYLGTTKEAVKEAKKIILAEFDKIVNSLTEKELEEVKEQIIGNYHISMEDSQSQMVNLLVSEIDEGEAQEYYDFPKKISAVKIKDVKDIAKKAIEKHSFYALVPE